MIRYSTVLIGFGLAYSGFPVGSAAQEVDYAAANPASIPTAEMGQGNLVPSPPIQNHNGYLSGGPAVVLPVPVAASGTPGFNDTYGFQYPGSYLPRDTPLHRFNGYIVCDPPSPVTGATGETTSEPTGVPVARRMVKITTTRSLAAPAYLQPCPIYTINGEMQKSNSYTTRSSR
jgi:hypothetical protein